MPNIIILSDNSRAACLHLKRAIDAFDALPHVPEIQRDMLQDALLDLLGEYGLLEDEAFGVEFDDAPSPVG